MRIVSWNVNGLRAIVKKGFCEMLPGFDADIVGLQEIKANEEQAKEACLKIDSYHRYSHSAQRPGYSGVMAFCKNEPKAIITKLDIDQFDQEGRVLILFYDDFLVANVYFPNGAGKNGDNSRVPYKLQFYDAFFDFLATLPGPKFVIGDFNVAYEEKDLARPKQNQKSSGFLPIEREHFGNVLKRGYVDTFRHFNQEPHQYTWWNMRFKNRERNVGWRIDTVLASHDALPMVKAAFIWPHIMGSDHCPVGVDLDFGPRT